MEPYRKPGLKHAHCDQKEPPKNTRPWTVAESERDLQLVLPCGYVTPTFTRYTDQTHKLVGCGIPELEKMGEDAEKKRQEESALRWHERGKAFREYTRQKNQAKKLVGVERAPPLDDDEEMRWPNDPYKKCTTCHMGGTGCWTVTLGTKPWYPVKK